MNRSKCRQFLFFLSGRLDNTRAIQFSSFIFHSKLAMIYKVLFFVLYSIFFIPLFVLEGKRLGKENNIIVQKGDSQRLFQLKDWRGQILCFPTRIRQLVFRSETRFKDSCLYISIIQYSLFYYYYILSKILYTGWSKKKFMMWSRGKVLEKF